MIDKSRRKAASQRCGDVVVIRMTGGPDCLWLNMYLDLAEWQMTCDSDIGSYAYRWGKGASCDEDFLQFCCRWFEDEEWLLRKCIGERHGEKAFDGETSVKELLAMYCEENGEDTDTEDIEGVLEAAEGFSNNRDQWAAAIFTAAECRCVELPEFWFECISTDYTPWQKRFAEICREVIVPELKRHGNDLRYPDFHEGITQRAYGR